MNTATRQNSTLLQYHAQAKRYLYERDRLDEATPEELASVADWLRYESFRRAIEPYERARNLVMSRWLSLQVNPRTDMSPEIKNMIDGWNELIVCQAREFGFEVTPPAAPPAPESQPPTVQAEHTGSSSGQMPGDSP